MTIDYEIERLTDSYSLFTWNSGVYKAIAPVGDTPDGFPRIEITDLRFGLCVGPNLALDPCSEAKIFFHCRVWSDIHDRARFLTPEIVANLRRNNVELKVAIDVWGRENPRNSFTVYCRDLKRLVDVVAALEPQFMLDSVPDVDVPDLVVPNGGQLPRIGLPEVGPGWAPAPEAPKIGDSRPHL